MLWLFHCIFQPAFSSTAFSFSSLKEIKLIHRKEVKQLPRWKGNIHLHVSELVCHFFVIHDVALTGHCKKIQTKSSLKYTGRKSINKVLIIMWQSGVTFCHYSKTLQCDDSPFIRFFCFQNTILAIYLSDSNSVFWKCVN